MYTQDFLNILDEVLGIEGGRTNYAWDPGGDTVFGISKHYWPKYWEYGPPGVELAYKFYWEEFWVPLRLADLAQEALRFEIFDTAVNCGGHNAVVFAQRAYNLLRPRNWPVINPDGVIGPKTIGALNHMCQRYTAALLGGCNYYQADYYAHLGDALKEEAIRGWFAKRLAWSVDE